MYNQNIFKIDDFERYYSGSILARSASNYKLYFGDATLPSSDSFIDASITNICIQSPIVNLDTIFKGELRCGDSVYGSLNWSEQVYYYYFQLPQTSDVILDACGSSSFSYIDLHTVDYLQVPEYNNKVWEDNCVPGVRLLIPSLPKGRYILEIGANSDIKENYNLQSVWWLQIGCSIDMYSHQAGSLYYVIPELIIQNIQWFEAERQCESIHGTTLATIITDEDLTQAFEAIDANFDISSNISISVWIGLAQTAVDTLGWQWVDGHSCDYTSSGNCIDDVHWHKNQPDGKPVSNSSVIWRSGAALIITQHSNHSNLPTFYDYPFDAQPSGGLFFLCNGPDSKYNVKNCSYRSETDYTCWEYDSWEHQFSDPNIESDTGLFYTPFIGHYNSTLFLIGTNEIHYTNMQPFDENLEWYHKAYHSDTVWDNAQLYAQHKELIYIYGTQYNQVVLLQIDLNTLQTTKYNVLLDESVPRFTKCIVAAENVVYFIQQARVFTYYTNEKRLETESRFGSRSKSFPYFTERTATTSCIITDNVQLIYVFAMSYVSNLQLYNENLMFSIAKYEIGTGTIIDLQTSDKCLTRNGFVTAVASGNGNIYLHGCNAAAWKTMIFDTTTDGFQNTTVDIQTPSSNQMAYYRSSQLFAVDNNMLFLFTEAQNGFSAHVTVTNLVSIDLQQTESTPDVWPSDGFNIKYYMNIFANDFTDYYNVFLYTNDSNNDINQSVTFNTFKDECICSESIYKCYDCHQHFDLKSHLTLQDNMVDELIFRLIYNYHQQPHPLITPNSLKIPLQRCLISIVNPKSTGCKDNVGHCIISHFNLSANCYTRNSTNFVLNITASHVNKQLIIGILQNNKMTCKVCDIGSKSKINCDECNRNQFTIVPDLDSISDTTFTFSFVSNMIDLIVKPPVNPILNHWRDWDKRYLYLLIGGSICFVFMLIGIVVYARRQYKKYSSAFIVDDALVLIIPIDTFYKTDTEGTNKKERDPSLYLQGVRPAMQKLECLWNKYNYDVFICNAANRESTKTNVVKFVDDNLLRLNNKDYTAIIMHVISHGDNGERCTFKSTDLQDIPVDFLKHELTEAAEDKKYDIIKLIFNHACQGGNDYSVGIRSSDQQYEFMRFKSANSTSASINNSMCPQSDDISADLNLEVIAGNEPGRTMSDSGVFTDCICTSFAENLKRWKKRDYNTLMVEITRNLAKQTGLAELMHRSGNLRENQIRFEKSKPTKDQLNNVYGESELTTVYEINRNNGYVKDSLHKPFLQK